LPSAPAQDRKRLLSRAYARRDRDELDLYEIVARRRAVVHRLTGIFGGGLGLRHGGLGKHWALAASLHAVLGELSVAWIRKSRRIDRLNRLIVRLTADLDRDTRGGES
jgi:hypothetical protein